MSKLHYDRDVKVSESTVKWADYYTLSQEAKSLRSENARLREALREALPFVNWADDHGCGNVTPWYAKARAALASSEKGGK